MDMNLNRSTMPETPFILLIGSTLTIHALSLGVPVMTLQVYDRVLPNENVSTLMVLLLGVGVAIVLEAILRVARSYMTLWLGAQYEHRMSCSVMDRIIGSDPSMLNRHTLGTMLHQMMSIGKLKEFQPSQVLIVCTDLSFIVAYLGIIAWIAGVLAAVPAGIIVLFVAISLPLGNYLRHALKEQEDNDDTRYNFLIERLNNIHILKAFGQENVTARRYERLAAASSGSSFTVTNRASASINFITLSSHIMIGSLISVGSLMVVAGSISVGTLIASILLSGRAMQMAQRGILYWVRYQDFTLAREKITAIEALPPIDGTGQADTAKHMGMISTNNISFRTHTGADILNDVSLEAAPGQAIAISGAVGAGKTVLLKTLAGIYPPSSGEIIVDGRPITEFTRKELAKRIAYLGPDATVFRATIRDNITRFGEIPMGQAMEVARLLNVAQDVAKLPAGYDTFIEDAATDKIPPGLKQRIALTRALAAEPRIMLYDAADRGLDQEGYICVTRLLSRLHGKATMIFVTDDQNILKRVSKAYHLSDGRLQLGRLNRVNNAEEVRV